VCQRICDATPIMYARYELSGESQFVEAKQTVGKDYGVFL
jgi:hypothetical protein